MTASSTDRSSVRVGEESALPEPRMPRCHKHFFTGYRWWCKRCSRHVEDEFTEVCIALWTLQRREVVVHLRCGHRAVRLDVEVDDVIVCPKCNLHRSVEWVGPTTGRPT